MFFTGERIVDYDCHWHKADVLAINWLPDDSGLVSASQDKYVQLWTFEKGARRYVWAKDPDNEKLRTYKRGFHTFSSLETSIVELEVPHGVKERKTELLVFGACTDGTFSEIQDSKDVARLECQTIFSTIKNLKGTNGPRAFLAGTAREGMPGSVRLVAYPNYKTM
jgi:WD40 repeat protein